MRYKRREKMSWGKRSKLVQGILITLVTILGLGVIGLTGKVLDDKYQWVEKARDKFKPVVLEPDEDEQERNIEIVLPNALYEFTDGMIPELEFEVNATHCYYYYYRSSISIDYPQEDFNIHLTVENDNSFMMKFEFLIDEVDFFVSSYDEALSYALKLDLGYRYDFSNLEAFDFDNNKLDPVITEL